MDTYQIAEPVLDIYKNTKLTKERIDFLISQANEQIDEISQDKELYDKFLKKTKAPQNINNIILWMLFMTNEDICYDYNKKFKKDFLGIIPVSDLADLLLYVVHLKKVEDTILDGFEYLLEYKEEGLEDVDQYCFTNVLLYIQKSKEVEIEF